MSQTRWAENRAGYACPRETILEQVLSTRYSGSPKFGSQVLNESLDALEGRWQGMAWPERELGRVGGQMAR